MTFMIRIALGLLCLSTTAGASDEYSAARAEFQAAHARVTSGQPDDVARDSSELRAYPLYPYLQAARLRSDFSLAMSGPPGPRTRDMEAFLELHGDEPVARDLRRDWLRETANTKRWQRYLDLYDPDIDRGTVWHCHQLAARAALAPAADLADDIVETWMSPKSLPEACDPAFNWLRTKGQLTPRLVEQRARLALDNGEAGLARYLARSLPPAEAAAILQWADLLQQPKKNIEALIAAPGRSVQTEALLAGWFRLARRDPDAAAGLFTELVTARRLDPRTAGRFALAVGLAASWSRKSYALDYFGRVSAEDYDEIAHEWHVRAALWAGDWRRAKSAIEAMPPALREDSSWRYWAARANEQLGDNDAAREGYAAVVPTDNWYAVWSAARLGRPFAPDLQPMPVSAKEVARVAGQPGMLRARELSALLMTGSAKAEWRWTYDRLSPDDQIQAIGLASEWGWHLQAVAAAAKKGLFNDYLLLYPRPYDREVREAATFTGLPAELIYAVIRQESLYQADAGSRAGARGLMQLMPATARRTAKRWDLPAPSNVRLLDPATNIRLGAATLASLVRRADQQVPLALAGYNAGPAAARRWLPDAPLETDIWVENIPYNETRGYVRRVYWHALVFGWLEDRSPQDVKHWMTRTWRPAADAALQSK